MQASGSSREEVLESVLRGNPDLKIVACERIDLSDIRLNNPAPTNVWAVAFEDSNPDEFIQDADPIAKVKNEVRHFYEMLGHDPGLLPTGVIEGPFTCPACFKEVDLELPPDRVQERMPPLAPVHSRCPACGKALYRLQGSAPDSWQIAVSRETEVDESEPESPGRGLGVRRACIFCGAEDQKITKEHLWSKWLRDYVESSGGTTRRIHGNDGMKIKSQKEWPSDGLDREISGPCKQCNGGWMSVLEDEAAPLLIPMLRNEEVELRPPEQRVVSLWATLKMLVAHEGHGNVKRVIPRDRYRQFYADRRLPVGAEIWLGRYNGAGPWPTSYQYRELFITPPGEEKVTQPNAYLVGFTIAYLAFFIWGHELRYGPAADIRQIEPYLTQVWPATGVTKWPPPGLLEADGLRFAMERFPIRGWV